MKLPLRELHLGAQDLPVFGRRVARRRVVGRRVDGDLVVCCMGGDLVAGGVLVVASVEALGRAAGAIVLPVLEPFRP